MEKSYESDPRLKLDQLSFEDLLAHITKTLTPKDRLQIFQSHETMMAVLKKYQEQALTIAAVLLTEQENLLWLNKDLQASAVINKAAYKTPFSQALALKAASTIPSPFTETTRLLCFESVLYAAYLGCLLSAEEVGNFLTNTRPQSIQPQEVEAMRPLWKALGYKPDAPHYEADVVKAEKVLTDQQKSITQVIGQIIFLGERGGVINTEGFKYDVPWHIGISVGQGNFVGIPGKGQNERQAQENIAAYAQGANYRVAVGPYVSALLPLIKQNTTKQKK